MADLNLTQSEADALIAIEKICVTDERFDYPDLGGSVCIPLVAFNKREDFLLDIYRGRIALLKVSHQNRARHSVILVRLDLGGSTHYNPDGETIPCPHLHIYREGYGDKWAFPLPEQKFQRTSDLFQILRDFMSYCNITKPPLIQERLLI